MNENEKDNSMIFQYLSDALFHGKFLDRNVPERQELIQQGIFSLVAPDIAENLIAKNIRVEEAHQNLHQLLSEKGISYVMLKGWASAEYYPEPILRTLGDVDFFVEDVETAVQTLNEAGFLFHSVKGEEHHHYEFFYDKTEYELHWRINGVPDGDGGKVQSYLDNIIEKAEFRNGMMLPSAFHHGLVILLHLARHMTTSGIGLRHLADWAVYLDRISKETEERLLLCLQDCGLLHFAKLLTACCYRIGLSEKAWVGTQDPALIDEILKDITEAGNFGIKKEIHSESLLISGLSSESQSKSAFTQLFRTLTDVTCLHWPAAEKVPVLIPFGWVYYSARYVILSFVGKREKVQIRKMISGANKRRALYKELKLFEPESAEDGKNENHRI